MNRAADWAAHEIGDYNFMVSNCNIWTEKAARQLDTVIKVYANCGKVIAYNGKDCQYGGISIGRGFLSLVSPPIGIINAVVDTVKVLMDEFVVPIKCKKCDNGGYCSHD